VRFRPTLPLPSQIPELVPKIPHLNTGDLGIPEDIINLEMFLHPIVSKLLGPARKIIGWTTSLGIILIVIPSISIAIEFAAKYSPQKLKDWMEGIKKESKGESIPNANEKANSPPNAKLEEVRVHVPGRCNTMAQGDGKPANINVLHSNAPPLRPKAKTEPVKPINFKFPFKKSKESPK
jgi:hypothetical protein